MGRFVSADTIVPGSENPQAFNRYSYVFNNPLIYVDPSGNEPSNPCDNAQCEAPAPPPPGEDDQWDHLSQFMTYADYAQGRDWFEIYTSMPGVFGVHQQADVYGDDPRLFNADVYSEYAGLGLLETSVNGLSTEEAVGSLLDAQESLDFLGGFGAAAAMVTFSGLNSKSAARNSLKSLNLPKKQFSAANRAIGRGTRASTYNITLGNDNVLTVEVVRPGRNGYQVMENTIHPNGNKTVIQKAYDADNNLDHFDPKNY